MLPFASNDGDVAYEGTPRLLTQTTVPTNAPSAFVASNQTDSNWAGFALDWPLAGRVLFAILIFVASGFCEIGGGWLVWQTVRTQKPWYWAFFGSLILVTYGFVATSNPLANFGRVYAIYGGFFILLSYGWAAVLDGFQLDTGDYAGLAVVLVGVLIILAWPR